MLPEVTFTPHLLDGRVGEQHVDADERTAGTVFDQQEKAGQQRRLLRARHRNASAYSTMMPR